jgi:2-polyprenyl-3-methyl-5-hydroxy-6-metoxy-1,4-benzoquinol methylase
MTIQSLWSDLLVGKGEAIHQSRWRRFLVAIMESRQKKADEVVQDYHGPCSIDMLEAGFLALLCKNMTASASQAQIEAATAYEALFVPALFGPWAPIVADSARIKTGDRVLDIACGTGVLAREAAARTGQMGHVAGLDPHAGMLAVASDLHPRSTGGTERPRRCRSRIGLSTSWSVSLVSCSLRTATRRSTRCCA